MPLDVHIALDRLTELLMAQERGREDAGRDGELTPAEVHEQLRQVAEDPLLIAALDPIRRAPPCKVVCGKCRRKLSYWAFSPTGGQVWFHENGPRREWVAKRAENPGYPLGPQPPEPFNYWAIGGGLIGPDTEPRDPSADMGKWLRWQFRCGKCNHAVIVTNTTMIRRLLTSLARGERKIVL